MITPSRTSCNFEKGTHVLDFAGTGPFPCLNKPWSSTVINHREERQGHSYPEATLSPQYHSHRSQDRHCSMETLRFMSGLGSSATVALALRGEARQDVQGDWSHRTTPQHEPVLLPATVNGRISALWPSVCVHPAMTLSLAVLQPQHQLLPRGAAERGPKSPLKPPPTPRRR